MHPMNASIDRRRFRALVRAIAVAGGLAMSALASMPGPVHAIERGRMYLAQDQRRDTWQRMTPEQREQWRNARTPGERARSGQPPAADPRGQVTADERQAMRQRFLEQQGRPPMPQDTASRRQLSPEERQQLRQQIEQARDQYRRGNGGNRGPGK